jgi:benzodiazapine receptor
MRRAIEAWSRERRLLGGARQWGFMRSLSGLVGWIVLSLSAGFIGSRFPVDGWYIALEKPPFNPPGFVFAPVWTALYVCMGIAAWLVWKSRGLSGAPVALGLFVGQLALNALWSYLFFGAHKPMFALIDIAALWVLIFATMLAFWKIRIPSGVLMMPCLAWVSFASVLNFSIWRLNS